MIALNRLMLSRAAPSRSRPASSILLALFVAAPGLASAGCALLFVDGPPAAHKNQPYFDCTTSNVAPTIDVVFAALYGLEGAGLLIDRAASSSSSSGVSSGSSSEQMTVGVVALGLGALFATSAVTGYGKTSACRQAKTELIERASRHQGAPGFAPPPPGFGPGMPAPYQPPQQPYDPWVSPPPGEMNPGPPLQAPPGAAPSSPSPTPAPPPAPKPPTAADTEEPSR
jgi:hypothetical protein